MNLEEELQERVEKERLHAFEKNDPEVKVYKSVFNALKNAPQYTAPADLADVVLKRIDTKSQSKSLFHNDYLWLAFGIMILFAAAIFVVLQMNYKIDFGFLNDLAAYKRLIIFGALFITLINLVDRRLVRRKKSFT